MAKYYYSTDQETYTELGEFDSRDEAVQWAMGELDYLDHEHDFEIAVEGEPFELDWSFVFDGERLLDDVVETIAPECNEDACDTFRETGREHSDDLVKRLAAAAEAWQKEHGIVINGVEQVTTHNLPAATDEEAKNCLCETCSKKRYAEQLDEAAMEE